MNRDKAYFILGINESQDITVELIKRQYKKRALQFHPDKNTSEDAKHKFQDISEAYQYLTKDNNFEYSSNEYSSNEYSHNEFYEMFSKNLYTEFHTEFASQSTYTNTLFSFLGNVIGKDIFNNIQTKIFYMIIQRLCNSCESNAFEIIKRLDKSIIQKIYDVLEMYQEVFHFSEDFLIKIMELIQMKSQNDECIKLYTFLEDLMEDNLYRLTVNQRKYIIPLWFHELVYDQDGHDIYVQCIPILPDNMRLDENNNLYISLKYSISDIWDKSEIVVVQFGKIDVTFQPSQLKLCKNQKYILGNRGISKINTLNIYDITKKGDIILDIELHSP